MLAECLRFGESTFNLEILSDLVLFTRDTNCIPLALCVQENNLQRSGCFDKSQGALKKRSECFHKGRRIIGNHVLELYTGYRMKLEGVGDVWKRNGLWGIGNESRQWEECRC